MRGCKGGDGHTNSATAADGGVVFSVCASTTCAAEPELTGDWISAGWFSAFDMHGNNIPASSNEAARLRHFQTVSAKFRQFNCLVLNSTPETAVRTLPMVLKSTLFEHIVQKALSKADLRLKITDLRKNLRPAA